MFMCFNEALYFKVIILCLVSCFRAVMLSSSLLCVVSPIVSVVSPAPMRFTSSREVGVRDV